MSEKIDTLADALPREIARVRDVLGHYHALGTAGMFGAAFIEQDLKEADKAVMSGDVIAMIRIYQKLQEIN